MDNDAGVAAEPAAAQSPSADTGSAPVQSSTTDQFAPGAEGKQDTDQSIPKYRFDEISTNYKDLQAKYDALAKEVRDVNQPKRMRNVQGLPDDIADVVSKMDLPKFDAKQYQTPEELYADISPHIINEVMRVLEAKQKQQQDQDAAFDADLNKAKERAGSNWTAFEGWATKFITETGYNGSIEKLYAQYETLSPAEKEREEAAAKVSNGQSKPKGKDAKKYDELTRNPLRSAFAGSLN